jgi:hypothetical protein
VRHLVDSLARNFQEAVENIVYLDHVDSTHALSLRIMDQMDGQGLELGPTVIIAGQQTLGRGRGDRRWESPAGGLYLSWARSGLARDTITALPMLAAAAALRAITENGVAEAGIKWPNDIVVDGKKLAGILIHVRGGEGGWATVGLGINLRTAPDVSRTAAAATTAMADLVESAPWIHLLADSFSCRSRPCARPVATAADPPSRRAPVRAPGRREDPDRDLPGAHGRGIPEVGHQRRRTDHHER